MSDTPNRKETGLIPAGTTALTTRSSALVKRGLETLASQRGHIVHFSSDRSLGILGLYNPGKHMFDGYETFGDARGDVTVPHGKKLGLIVCDEVGQRIGWEAGWLQKPRPGEVVGSIACERVFGDLSALTTLRSDDLQGLFLVSADELFDKNLEHIVHLQLLEQAWVMGRLTDTGLAHLGQLTHLMSLTLYLGNSHITAAGFVHLRKLVELDELDLLYCKERINTALADITTLKKLRVLNLCGSLLDEKSFSYLYQLPRLGILRLGKGEIYDAEVAKYICRLTNLTGLWLNDTRITDKGLSYLVDLRLLERLDLTGTAVGEGTVAELQRELPNCVITK